MAKGTKKAGEKTAGISDGAVCKATGKTWTEWGTLLDKDGCRKMPHKEIAKIVHVKHGVGDWWSQMVTVGYEQLRGLRKPHQMVDGWKCSVSRTVDVSVSRLFSAWSDEDVRQSWMGRRKLVVRKVTTNKSMRITCHDQTGLEVNFYSKGGAKSQVSVQHSKLKGEADVARSKKYWAGVLGKLKKALSVSK